jgi:hypothetical protein
VPADTDTAKRKNNVVKTRVSKYLKCVAPRIVGNFCERIEKMVSCCFPLKADGVEELEGADSDHALGIIRCHGEPAVREELLPMGLGATASTLTKVDRHVVEAVRGNNHECPPPRLSVRAFSAVRVSKLYP